MGDVYARNPETQVFGPVCDENWDINDVSFRPFVFFAIIFFGIFSAQGTPSTLSGFIRFSLFPYNTLLSCQTFLPLLLATLTGYLDWG